MGPSASIFVEYHGPSSVHGWFVNGSFKRYLMKQLLHTVRGVPSSEKAGPLLGRKRVDLSQHMLQMVLESSSSSFSFWRWGRTAWLSDEDMMSFDVDV